MRLWLVVGIACAWSSASAGRAVAQDPAENGPFAVDEWDAGSVSTAGASIPTSVAYPTDAPGPVPVVGIIHGLNGTRDNHLALARTVASWGAVAIVPTMPCSLTAGCDHAANGAQINALLDWAVAQSGDAGSPIAGTVDGERRGLIGHSWGGLGSHIAASMDDRIDSLVLFDPNDDGTEGLSATPSVSARTAQLLAEVAGACNGAWRENEVHAMLPEPKLVLTVAGAGHCDPSDADEFICNVACSSGDHARTHASFVRYAVAWTHCILGADEAMAPWVGGSSMASDMAAGTITNVSSAGLEALPCRSGVGPTKDGGMSGTDGGTSSGDAPADASRGAGGGDGGCGCLAAGARSKTPPGALAVLLVLLFGGRWVLRTNRAGRTTAPWAQRVHDSSRL
jgi:dienelactone hydrolase